MLTEKERGSHLRAIEVHKVVSMSVSISTMTVWVSGSNLHVVSAYSMLDGRPSAETISLCKL